MRDHYKQAILIATLAWVLLAVVPAALLSQFPQIGLDIGRVAFFGCILGAVLWFQAVFTADASDSYGLLDFSFLLSCTAMGAFVTLAGDAILNGSDNTGSAGFVFSGSLQLYFVGVLLSLASSLVSARSIGAASDAGAGMRLLSIALCSGVFVFYIMLMMVRSGG